MAYAVKESSRVQAWELGSGSVMEQEMIRCGKIVARPGGIYEVFSREATGKTGQIAAAGDFFKVDDYGFPHPWRRAAFLQQHQALEEDWYQEAARQVKIWRLADPVCEEIRFLLDREERGCMLNRMMQDGSLPTRATHNDTKINNVLMDKDTRKAICVIDLDTVMPGLSVYDFGDAIRYGASTASEDETDLSKVSLDLDLFRIFVRGFCEACPSLTPEEIRMLPLGAYTMTLECGIRFLADYLNGDKYFSIDREKQNLDRAHTQFKLIEDMERKWDEMERIVKEETED